jgi:cell division septum initiation protein DivIVA
MKIDEITKRMDEFIDLVDIFGHMPEYERTKKKNEDLQKKLLVILKEVKGGVMKEVSELHIIRRTFSKCHEN